MSRPVTDPNLLDLTNVYRGQAPTTGLPTPPSERKRVRQLEFDVRDKKRLKFDTPTNDDHPTDVDSDTSTDDEDEDKPPRTKTTCQYSVYGLRTQMMLAGPSRMPSPSMSEPHFVCILSHIVTWQCSVHYTHSAVVRLFSQGRLLQMPVHRRISVRHHPLRMRILPW